ncbi:MAG TPA: hypothetical protein VH684_08765 [Xanthobacteraceae bacterium]|jgi:hypothetical protein
MRFCCTLAALAFIPLPAAAADELPNELLLRCEGNMNAVLDSPTAQTRSTGFSIILRLKNRSVVDDQTGVVEGAECVQQNGEIRCEVTKVYPLPNSIVKRFSTVFINRNTRELTLWVESWDYPGADASGTPTAHLRALRTGMCRDDAMF